MDEAIPLTSRTTDTPAQANAAPARADQQSSVAARYPRATTPVTPKEKDWKGWKLHWITMGFMVIMEGGLIATIVYLIIRSTSQNGIATVPQASVLISLRFPISKIWKYGLLWTTLPSLLMTVYKLAWDTIVTASMNRQPFVGLKKGASVRKTIMLDYRAHMQLFAWVKALANGHILLGFAMFLGQAFSIAVVPLTAHLFVAALSQSTSPVALSYPTTYNEFGLDSSTSLQPSIDLASANRVYNATPPPWTTLQYVLEPFDLSTPTGPSGNVTAATAAYSATLDCRSYSPSESNPIYQTDGGGASVSYHMTDRGCEVSGYMEIYSATPTYAMSWTTPCNSSEQNRIGIFAGIYSNDSSIKIDLASYSLISCTIDYWNLSGYANMAVQPNESPKLLSFDATTNNSMSPFLHNLLEENFLNYKFFDPSNNIQADAFGYSVYAYARTKNTTEPIAPDLIRNSFEDMYQTLYAGMISQVALSQAISPRNSNGELSTSVTRLYVVVPIAWTIVATLALILICNVFLLIYAQKEASILLEEPIGVLGIAALMHPDDDVAEFVTRFRADHPHEWGLRDFVDDNYTVKESMCRIDDKRRIRIENLEMANKRPRTCVVQ